MKLTIPIDMLGETLHELVKQGLMFEAAVTDGFVVITFTGGF